MLPLIIKTTYNILKKETFNATGILILINNEKLKDPRQLADVLFFL
jgi:hypothetical protein